MINMMQIVTRSFVLPAIASDRERAVIYKEAFAKAKAELEPEDRRVISKLQDPVEGMGTKVRGLGAQGVLEVLGALGVMLAAMTEEQFDRMLQLRREKE